MVKVLEPRLTEVEVWSPSASVSVCTSCRSVANAVVSVAGSSGLLVSPCQMFCVSVNVTTPDEFTEIVKYVLPEVIKPALAAVLPRSEERRVGKECRTRLAWSQATKTLPGPDDGST